MRTTTISKVPRWMAWFLLILFWMVALLQAQSSFAEDDPPARAARISYLKGKVSFQPGGHDQWAEATLNFTVTTGDRLYCEKGARAELEAGPFAIRISDAEQRRIMVEHPGRPLEPQQLEDLRGGRQAGPMVDREFPPHAMPVPHARPTLSRQRKP